MDSTAKAGSAPRLGALTSAIAPVRAVWGKTDGWDVRARVPEVVQELIEGFSVRGRPQAAGGED